MKPETKEQIRAFIEGFATKMLSKVQGASIDDLRRAYPFHELFFRGDAIVAFTLQRSIVTSMGKKLYPNLAKIIASDGYRSVHLDHPIEGQLHDATCNKIEQIVTDLRNRRRRPNHEEEMKEILYATTPDDSGYLRPASVICDLYIDDFCDGPFFAEMKTPKPNLDICAESKRKILYFLAIMQTQEYEGAAGYLAFPYNPFLSRERYAHNFTRQVMDMEEEVLMGEEFWNKIGGTGAYEEVLQIITDVRSRLPLV